MLDEAGLEAAGAVNGYLCERCGKTVYTRNAAVGTTPFAIGCLAVPGCTGRARSLWYRVPSQAVATWEWYRPSLKWARRKGPAMLGYVKLGGMALRSYAGDGPG